MSVKKYVVVVNIEKYPSVVEKLEEEKKIDGISRYFRNLVLKDIKTQLEQETKTSMLKTNAIEELKKKKGFV